MQELFRKRAGKIITREIYNIKELEVNKYRKAFTAAFKPVDLEFSDFAFPDLFFWNPSDFFFGSLGKPFKYALDFS